MDILLAYRLHDEVTATSLYFSNHPSLFFRSLKRSIFIIVSIISDSSSAFRHLEVTHIP